MFFAINVGTMSKSKKIETAKLVVINKGTEWTWLYGTEWLWHKFIRFKGFYWIRREKAGLVEYVVCPMIDSKGVWWAMADNWKCQYVGDTIWHTPAFTDNLILSIFYNTYNTLHSYYIICPNPLNLSDTDKFSSLSVAFYDYHYL